MSQENAARMTVPPPGVPLKTLVEPIPAPVPPPAPLQAAAPKAPAAPGAPKLAAVPPKKERRMELEGLEGGDPRSTVHLVRLGIRNAAQTLPAMIKKYAWAIPAVLFVWTVLGSFNAYKLVSTVPSLTPLWLFLDKIVLVLVFLTASYNSFIGKAVYATLIIKVGIPLVRRMQREGFGKVSNEFMTLIPNLKANWSLAGSKSLGLMMFFAGSGAFLSNFLTRNNAIDKIAVSLVIAFSLMKALSDGPRSIPFMTGRVVMKDLFVAMRKPSPVRNHHIYVALSGLTAGFLCCLPLAVLRKALGESIGYQLGVVAMIVGVGLMMTLRMRGADEKTP